MSFRNDGKQVMQYEYDFDVDGGATGEIFLSSKDGSRAVPIGAVITAVSMRVVTAFTSGGSATLAYGNDDDPDGYSGSAIAVASLVDNLNTNGQDNAAVLLLDDTNVCGCDCMMMVVAFVYRYMIQNSQKVNGIYGSCLMMKVRTLEVEIQMGKFDIEKCSDRVLEGQLKAAMRREDNEEYQKQCRDEVDRRKKRREDRKKAKGE